MSQLAAVSKVAETRAIRARNIELASQLRAAASAGDDARINRLLAELLRCKGLSRGQRIALQQKALTSLVQSLRSAAVRLVVRLQGNDVHPLQTAGHEGAVRGEDELHAGEGSGDRPRSPG